MLSNTYFKFKSYIDALKSWIGSSPVEIVDPEPKTKKGNYAKQYKVLQLSLDNDPIAIYPSLASVERHLGFSRANVLRAIKTERTCGGFRWRKV